MDKNSPGDLLDILYSNAPKISQLCTPLFRDLGLGFFAHGRFFHDGSAFLTSTHPKLYEHFLNQNYGLVAPLPKNLNTHSFFYLVNAAKDYVQEDDEVGQLFGLYDAINHIEIHPHHYDFYCYGHAQNNPGQINFLINQTQKIIQFKNHLHLEQKNLIQDLGLNHRVILPALFRQSIDQHRSDEQIRKAQTKSSQLILNTLTPRETECFRLITQGYSAKMIGRALGISHRSAEKHIENLKIKLGVSHRSELIKLEL